MPKGIDHLIVNSPFVEPTCYWSYERERQRFVKREGRRPAGFVRATPGKENRQEGSSARTSVRSIFSNILIRL